MSTRKEDAAGDAPAANAGAGPDRRRVRMCIGDASPSAVTLRRMGDGGSGGWPYAHVDANTDVDDDGVAVEEGAALQVNGTRGGAPEVFGGKGGWLDGGSGGCVEPTPGEYRGSGGCAPARLCACPAAGDWAGKGSAGTEGGSGGGDICGERIGNADELADGGAGGRGGRPLDVLGGSGGGGCNATPGLARFRGDAAGNHADPDGGNGGCDRGSGGCDGGSGGCDCCHCAVGAACGWWWCGWWWCGCW